MLALSRLKLLEKSLSTRVKASIHKFRYSEVSFLKPKTSYNIKSEVNQDVVLFKFDNAKFFLLINALSGAQFFFWTYLSVFLFQSIRDPVFEEKERGFWGRILEKERKHGNILTLVSAAFGVSIFIGTLAYTVRSVRKIVLHRGGKDVSIYTYNLPGYNSVKVPLNCISASQHRTKAKKFISLKIKNRFFYYLIDVNGDFVNPTLFDFTAGVNRNV